MVKQRALAMGNASECTRKSLLLKENILPIQESGQLYFTEEHPELVAELPFEILYVDGHTEKQMLPLVPYKGRTLAYVADLIATAGHVPVPYIMGYDTRPLITMTEKASFLDRAVADNYLLLFEHDAYNQLASVRATEKGVRIDQILDFNSFFS